MADTRKQCIAYAVHLYTASGMILAFWAATEIIQSQPNVRLIFLLLFLAVVIDATDGTLARKFNVKRYAPSTDGRSLDDIVDYMTYTFLPLFLMWRMDWLPEPAILWVAPALISSLFGFSNTKAKDGNEGYFLGFPSYWNYVAFYAGLWTFPEAKYINAAIVLVLSVLTIVPVKFLYPNLSPKPWRFWVMTGAIVWQILLATMLLAYPQAPIWLILLSLSYPLFYTLLSFSLLHKNRKPF